MLVSKVSPEFNKFMSPFLYGATKNYSIPATNIIEKDNNFVIETAAPGLKKEDFNIELDNNVLKISAKRTSKTLGEGENYHRKEFAFETFERRFKLPNTVDSEAIEARYEDGILSVLLNKSEALKRRAITIA